MSQTIYSVFRTVVMSSVDLRLGRLDEVLSRIVGELRCSLTRGDEGVKERWE
jgi:hypothetical protein